MTRRNQGFTLIELMIVVGIMVLISAIVVSSSFGLSRASGYSAAENVVYNTLQLARQKACTDGKRVVVAFVSEKDKYEDDSLTAIEATGTVTGGGKNVGNYIQDRCANLAKYTASGKQSSGESSATLWNLRTGARVVGFRISIKKDISDDIPGTAKKGKFYYDATQINPLSGGSFSNWEKGDPYGFEILPVQYLPKGFKIGLGSTSASPANTAIVFEPNGTSFRANADGLTKAGDAAELWVYEEIAKSESSRAIKIKVDKGVVTVVGK